ncbi:hypothetical protein [Pseudoalteromonas sp. S558]|uniref:hypothetical protein n=1 Tax=Pseudoalteromonas sp. S558 TaxID=2066515 RepID=UPI00110B4E11|nr:hypothetical protein [Pseudoalteromonas sp. S558]TMN98285.1 hypothetical protein CWB66_16615 [Pseudoalteromonas sp. S558]
MKNINWFTDEPSEIGLHFVAVKYGEGAGTFDFIEWNGTKWLTEYEGEVIAYTTLEGLIRDSDIAWPEEIKEVTTKTDSNLDTSSLWKEI